MLDIGCGEGKLLTYLLTLDIGIKKFVGVDIDISSLEKAKNISLAKKGKPLSEAHKEALKAAKVGKPWSEARRAAGHHRKS